MVAYTSAYSCLEVPPRPALGRGRHPLTVVEAVDGKSVPREEGAPLCHREALHFRVGLDRLLDGAVFPVQPVPAPHAAVQARVNLERQAADSWWLPELGHRNGRLEQERFRA